MKLLFFLCLLSCLISWLFISVWWSTQLFINCLTDLFCHLSSVNCLLICLRLDAALWLVGRWNDWLVVHMAAWLITKLAAWLQICLLDYYIMWLPGCWYDCWTNSLSDWICLLLWFYGSLVFWLASCCSGCLGLSDWLIFCMTTRRTLTDWLGVDVISWLLRQLIAYLWLLSHHWKATWLASSDTLAWLIGELSDWLLACLLGW